MRRSPAALYGALALAAAAAAQPPPSAGGERYQAGQYVGPASCATASCHGKSTPSADTAVLQNEYATWVHRDPHFRAHESLYGERARIIARNLGGGRSPDGDSRCLGCHALVAPVSRQAERLDVADGVSCEACHGPAGGWLDRHAQREWSYGDSVAAGMIDLRSPPRRSAVCHRCHLGTPRHQVDHELIAAGHPELVFELDNFSEAMPSHWRSYGERSGGPGPRVLPPAAIWALGQIEGLRANLVQVAGRTEASRWPEFAELSCEDCHHSLAEERWRRPRAERGRLGMPRWSPARWTTLRHVVAALAPDALPRLSADVERLAALVGDLQASPEAVREAAERVAGQLADLMPRVRDARWPSARVLPVMAAIAADRDALATGDRQSAEQVALAVQSLHSSVLATAPSRVPEALAATVDELFDALQEPHAYQPEVFLAALEKLERQLE